MIKETYELVRGVLSDPEGFAEKVRSERGISRAVRFITVFSLFAFLFLTALYIDQLNMFSESFSRLTGLPELVKIELTWQTYLFAYASLVAVYIILSFARYYLTHLFIVLLGGKEPYATTYKAMSYSLAPEYISTPLLVLSSALFPFLYAGRLGTSGMALFIIAILSYLAVLVYNIYIRTAITSSLQGISTGRAFFSIYILSNLAQIALVLMIELLLILGYLYLTGNLQAIFRAAMLAAQGARG